MKDYYHIKHIEKIIENTNNLYNKYDDCSKCHYTKDDINCLFCFCPIYNDVHCGGQYKTLNNGIKDCSDCVLPHTKEFIIKYFLKNY